MVANVAARTSHGPGGQEVQIGLKHFSPGTKLWLVSPFWGYGGDRIEVLGRHRGSRRLARIVVERRHLTNFRVQGVYSPSVLRELGNAWPDKAEAERIAQYWNRISDAQAGVQHQTRRIELVERLTVISETTGPRVVDWILTSWFEWMLRDDVLADPTSAIGPLLRDQAEADAIRSLLELVRAVGAKNDIGYLEHPDWPRIASAAQAAATLLAQPTSADGAGAEDGCA
ncbi:hypothetical protein DMH04_21070 [Kibdelosporangium aridum]|uniref:Uncharacterized protein n=1 Tax=Kibdelosporangium aridum TaxID=2030 RepID=A0A428Z969_KIBAR|nr:hypothetical protein DMH04_21070 [Kibdelosporangium aridum]